MRAISSMATRQVLADLTAHAVAAGLPELEIESVGGVDAAEPVSYTHLDVYKRQIQDDFDLTLVNEMVVDHGLTVPLSLVYGELGTDEQWPVRVIPLAVNVVQYPVPSGRRCYELGKALRRAIDKWDGEALTLSLIHI